VNSVDKNIHFIDLGYGMETKTLAIVVGINGAFEWFKLLATH
jgi:hypothetical protein